MTVVLGRVDLAGGGAVGGALVDGQIKVSSSHVPVVATPDEARRLRLLLDTAIVTVERDQRQHERPQDAPSKEDQ